MKKAEKIEKQFKDRIAVLTIAYHNLAVEQEFLGVPHVAYVGSALHSFYFSIGSYLGDHRTAHNMESQRSRHLVMKSPVIVPFPEYCRKELPHHLYR